MPMRKILQMNPCRWLPPLLLACILCAGSGPAAAGLDANPAISLRARYAQLGPQLRDNPFRRPLYLDSAESPDQLKGDIYALVDYPFAAVRQALSEPAHWCELLILHLNIKYCRPSAGKAGSILAVSIGKKHYQPLAQAFRVDFAFVPAAAGPEYFDLRLNAKEGPLGTSDYRIRLEAVAVQGGKSFLHLTYSYSYNLAARIAMQAYLATIGSDKVGFTATGKQSAGRPGYIGGVVCAAVGIAATVPLFARVRGRLDASAQTALPLFTEGGALLLAALSVLLPPVGLLGLLGLLWLLFAGRGREQSKYAGLRILR